MMHHTETIEFVGGPFDGHRQGLMFPVQELNEVVELPVNTNILRLLNGQSREGSLPATSVAVYQLDPTTFPVRYRYCGAASAQHLQDWLG